MYGIAWYHPYLSHRSAAGWPDLALCGKRGFLLRELKTERGKLTADQERGGSILRIVGVSGDVGRLDDWKSVRVQRELLEIR